MMTSNWKGQLAVSKAQVRAIELGYYVSVPLMDYRYDLVLDDGKKLWRVQIKYANRKPHNSNGAVTVQLTYETRKRRRIVTYNSSEVDALVVYLPKIDKLCWFPTDVFVGKRGLNVRIDQPKNSQSKKIVMASSYFW
jgi:hypothetical protein